MSMAESPAAGPPSHHVVAAQQDEKMVMVELPSPMGTQPSTTNSPTLYHSDAVGGISSVGPDSSFPVTPTNPSPPLLAAAMDALPQYMISQIDLLTSLRHEMDKDDAQNKCKELSRLGVTFKLLNGLYECPVKGCGNSYTERSSVVRHLWETLVTCPNCHRQYARGDASTADRHLKTAACLERTQVLAQDGGDGRASVSAAGEQSHSPAEAGGA